MKDVTNSPKDVHDFWYNSPEDWGDYIQLNDTGEGINLQCNIKEESNNKEEGNNND